MSSTLRLVAPSGVAIEIKGDRAILGRESSCEVVVDDKSVSRRHAVIERRANAWVVRDQSSANGTFLAGQRVAEAELADGQELRLGAVVYQVVIDLDMPATMLLEPPGEAPIETVLLSDHLAGPAAQGRPAPAAPPSRAPSAPVAPPGAHPRAPAMAQRHPAAPSPVKGVPAAARGAAPGGMGAPAREPPQRRPPPADVPVSDLPAAQPVVVPHLLEDTGPKKGVIELTPPTGGPGKEAAQILRPATLYLMIASTLLIAIAVFFALSSGKTQKELAKLSSASELHAARQNAAKYAAARELLQNGVLKNEKVRLCNRSSVPVEVAWLATVYLRAEELPPAADRELAGLASGFNVARYNSAYCRNEFKLVLPPGAEQEPAFASSSVDRCNWDGSALFYSFAVVRAGPPAGAGEAGEPAESRPVWQSGLVAAGQGCVDVGKGR